MKSIHQELYARHYTEFWEWKNKFTVQFIKGDGLLDELLSIFLNELKVVLISKTLTFVL